MSVAAWSDAEWPEVPLVVGVCALTAALLIAPIVGGVVTGPAPVMATAIIALLTVTAGRSLTPLLRLPATVPRFLVSVAVGYAATSVVHLCATALLNVGVYVALGVDVLAVVALAVAAPQWRRSLTLPQVMPAPTSWQREVVVRLTVAHVAAVKD